jgi:hypothetical protein
LNAFFDLDEKTQLNSKIQKSNTLILNSNNEKKFLGKKLEFEEKEIVDNAESKVENEPLISAIDF